MQTRFSALMRGAFTGAIAGVIAVTVGASTANAGPIAYVTGTINPWGNTSNDTAMDTAFGAGNWDKFNGFNAGVLGAGYDFIFFDGGDGVSTEFHAFVNSNRTAIEDYVSGGGNLLLNMAGWETTGDTLNLGFGITTTVSFQAAMGAGSAVIPAHAIFNGPHSAAGSAWTGNFFAHNYLTGAGLNPLIVNGIGQTILADLSFGAGYVMFGGLTTPNFHSPGPQAASLRANMLDFAAAQVQQVQQVPEPLTLSLLLFGGATAVIRRRRSNRHSPAA